jgi:Fe-S-cluster containining protein
MKRPLPLFVERSLQQVQVDRDELSSEFESKILGVRSVSCHKGCAGCCYHPLLISVLEGVSLYRELVARGQWTPSLKTKLEESAETTSELSVQVWLLAKIPCPLLGPKNMCRAYEARPFACRVTLATGDPYYCDPQQFGPRTSIIPRKEISSEFHAREKALLHKHGLMHLTLPVGRAILLAEKVCTGEIMLENIDRTYIVSILTTESTEKAS